MGKKIKDLAFTFFIITVIAIIIAAIIVATSDSLYYVFRVGRVMAALTSAFAAIFLIILAYFFYVFISAFGELAEDTKAIRNILEGKRQEAKKNIDINEIDGVDEEEFKELQSDENIKKMLSEIVD